MEVVRATNQDDFNKAHAIALQWKQTCNSEAMGIKIIDEVYLADLLNLIKDDDKDLLLLVDDENNAIGYMGIFFFDCPLGGQRMANEHYWFIDEKQRGRGAMHLVKAAGQWAKEKGCSHLIMNASTLASDLHDKVCRFYERVGMTKIETSYIKEIT